MEIIVIVFLVIFLVVLLNQGSNTNRQFSRLEAELDQLRRQLAKNNTPAAPKGGESTRPAPPYTETATAPAPLPVAEELLPPIVSEPLPDTVKPAPVIIEVAETIMPPAAIRPAVTPAAHTTPVRNTDIEKFIGENLISKIGIGILVLAIGFFVKYAIDNDWIGPVGRVSVGLLCGSILIALAHRLRKQYTAFSSVLVGGGFGAFYFTITLAYQQFHLFGQTTAFLIMIVITAFATIISLLYKREELAIIAMIGGFAAPFMVSNGSGHYVSLFTYMAMLNTGLLVIAYFKNWRILNLLAFIFTTLIFAGWLLTGAYKHTGRFTTYRNGFIFATIFYLQFFVVTLAHHITHKTKFIASDFLIMLINTCAYAGFGLLCLQVMDNGNSKGFFSAALGMFNLLAARILLRRIKKDSNILYLLIGITLTFISLAAPLQLHGNYITLFWASEAVLLFWLYMRSKMYLVQLAAALVWGAMLISLFMDWVHVYLSSALPLAILVNKGCVTGLYAAGATFFLLVLRSRYDAWPVKTNGLLVPPQPVLLAFALFLLYATGVLEILHQFGHHYPYSGIRLLYLFCFTVLFIQLLLFVAVRLRIFRMAKGVLIGIILYAVLFYLLFTSSLFAIQAELLAGNGQRVHFTAHWAGAILLILLLVQLARLLRSGDGEFRFSYDGIAWAFSAFGIILITTEAHLLANAIFYTAETTLATIQAVFTRTVMPVLWGLCSFALMWTGMKYRYRSLRIISLALFALTLFKLFLFDIRGISAAGKIIAFFCLGVLLLLVSFMYQRLKKIIIDDDRK